MYINITSEYYTEDKKWHVRVINLLGSINIKISESEDRISLDSVMSNSEEDVPSDVCINILKKFGKVCGFALCEYVRCIILNAKITDDMQCIEDIVRQLCQLYNLEYIEHSLKYESAEEPSEVWVRNSVSNVSLHYGFCVYFGNDCELILKLFTYSGTFHYRVDTSEFIDEYSILIELNNNFMDTLAFKCIVGYAHIFAVAIDIIRGNIHV